MNSKNQNSFLSSGNFLFYGLVLFLLSGISYGVLTFVQNNLNGTNTNIIGMILIISLFICFIISPAYLILGFLDYFFSLEDNNEAKSN